jgi:hypothetical protein
MIVQAIALLDDLDKEINIYSMRVKVKCTISIFKTYLIRFLSSHRSGMVGISLKWPR